RACTKWPRRGTGNNDRRAFVNRAAGEQLGLGTGAGGARPETTHHAYSKRECPSHCESHECQKQVSSHGSLAERSAQLITNAERRSVAVPAVSDPPRTVAACPRVAGVGPAGRALADRGRTAVADIAGAAELVEYGRLRSRRSVRTT